MIEKLIENWLTNSNELGYQLPFCEALLAKGYCIIHISSHGPGEHGKDIVARGGDGKLWTFQLKGGDIRLSRWREIRGEVEELVRLPVVYPGISEDEPHTPVLVTNGEISGDSRDDINGFAKKWSSDKSGNLEVWSRRQLLALFVEAHGKFLPTSLPDFRQFVELYVSDFRERLPREKLSSLLVSLVNMKASRKKKALHVKRAIESMALVGGYIAHQYRMAKNHVSEAEAWTIIAATILHVAERENLDSDSFRGSLQITEIALKDCLRRLEAEALSRRDFLESEFPIADPFTYGARSLLSLGWLAAASLLPSSKGVPPSKEALRKIFLRETRYMKFLGESDWPSALAMALFMESRGAWRDADKLLEIWANRVISAHASDLKGFPSPYWLQEKVLLKNIGCLSPHEEEDFRGQSYTLMAALDMLVRRLCRQKLSYLWRSASRISECRFVPDHQADWFVWTCEEGVTLEIEHPLTVSWKEWRASAAVIDGESVPRMLIENPNWILPFSLTFPHRCTRSVSALADCMIGKRGKISQENTAKPKRRTRRTSSAKAASSVPKTS